VRFITSFAVVEDHIISVLDTGEDDTDISHVGDHWIAQDELAAVLAGGRGTANVLNADDYGVWVTGTAPVASSDGAIVGAVTVDVPALEWAPSLQSDQTHTLTAIVRAATIRYSRAEVEAITDSLTGLYNHRYLHERLDEELHRAFRYDGQLSLLFVDCDDFKGFNDAYGHKAGDQALARIARVLESCSRRIDLAGRYGGEEFVLVLVDTGPAGARKVAERVRSEVRATSLAAGQELTVSVGVAGYPRDASGKDELLDKADWAMYAAKRTGRDRVLSFRDGVVAKEWTSRAGGRARAHAR
jgi:diguanylate cyclase (GGDEF)-like protein